ncbi:MAG: zinc ABC transporter substrate-binding protein [Methanomassiliicoccales archaeon]|nr:zinc ABC transporter substrate-binding protein [Methanomassiliicoccales archaeon]
MVEFSKGARKAVATLIIVALLVGGAVLGFVLLGVGSPTSDKMQVVASFYPLYYFSSQIGGERAEVRSLIPDNVEPHSFEPTPVDLMIVSKARILVYNGEGFEPWMTNFISAVNNPSLIQVDTSKNVELLPSDTVKVPYEAAAKMLTGGPNASLATSALRSAAATVPYGDIVMNVTLAIVPGGWGGYFNLSISQAADYRFFVTDNVSFSVQYPNGTPVIPELVLGPLTWYPEFAASRFYELAAGTIYTVYFAPSTFNETRFGMYQAPLDQDTGAVHVHGVADPHFWIDPITAKVQVNNILAAFVTADPGNATYYQDNAANLNSRLDALNGDFMSGLANRTKNAIITTHEGFNYLAARYHFDAYGAIGISGDQQPTPQDLIRLTILVHQLQLHYVFSEPVFSDAVIETIAQETGTQVLILDGVHGRSGVHAGMDYFQIMRANLDNLRIGLEVRQ